MEITEVSMVRLVFMAINLTVSGLILGVPVWIFIGLCRFDPILRKKVETWINNEIHVLNHGRRPAFAVFMSIYLSLAIGSEITRSMVGIDSINVKFILILTILMSLTISFIVQGFWVISDLFDRIAKAKKWDIFWPWLVSILAFLGFVCWYTVPFLIRVANGIAAL
jgi:hypothetical protein